MVEEIFDELKIVKFQIIIKKNVLRLTKEHLNIKKL